MFLVIKLPVQNFSFGMYILYVKVGRDKVHVLTAYSRVRHGDVLEGNFLLYFLIRSSALFLFFLIIDNFCVLY